MSYEPVQAGVDPDLLLSSVPADTVLATLDPLLVQPLQLTDGEFRDLVQFLRTGLLDFRATPKFAMHLVPRRLPSGLPVHDFEVPGDD